jgi:drug/metabolite transporter (DMT)-like permease
VTVTPTRPAGLTLAAFGGAVLLGGANFVAVRFSNQELAPFWGAGLRFGTAAVLFAAIAVALRLKWPRGRLLAMTALYGALAFAVSYALMYWALVRVTAGTATIVLAAVPLVTLLLAVAQRLERLTPRAVLGSVLALAGITWMALGPQRVAVPLTALVAMIFATVAIGQSIILAKHVSRNHPAMTNAVGMAVAAILLLALSASVHEEWALPRQPEVMTAVVYLVTAGSVGLFVLVLLVVRRWTPSASSYMFVLFPVVTLALAAVLAGEPVTVHAVAGAALVMLGVWYGAFSSAGRTARSGAAAPRA